MVPLSPTTLLTIRVRQTPPEVATIIEAVPTILLTTTTVFSQGITSSQEAHIVVVEGVIMRLNSTARRAFNTGKWPVPALRPCSRCR